MAGGHFRTACEITLRREREGERAGKNEGRVTERRTSSSSGKGGLSLVCGSSSLPGDLH